MASRVSKYPRQFWVLSAGSFMNSLGAGLRFPFFTLYGRERFGASMALIGLIYTLNAISGIIGSALGGYLTDRVGRKTVMLFSLGASAVAMVAFALVRTLPLFVAVAMFNGFVWPLYNPARDAMVADLVPGGSRAPGYGVLRIASNLGMTAGPALGGFIVTRSYSLLFFGASVALALSFGLTVIMLRETFQSSSTTTRTISLFPAFATVLKDRTFVFFAIAAMMTTIPPSQLWTVLPVHIKEDMGLSGPIVGWVITTNPAMVVALQFAITAAVAKWRRLHAIALGALLYAIGVGLVGLSSKAWMFIGCMAVATMGEMLFQPVASAFVADLAPIQLRGRYMGMYSLVGSLAYGVGPAIGGVVVDAGHIGALWPGMFGLGVVAAGLFLWLNRRLAASAPALATESLPSGGQPAQREA